MVPGGSKLQQQVWTQPARQQLATSFQVLAASGC